MKSLSLFLVEVPRPQDFFSKLIKDVKGWLTPLITQNLDTILTVLFFVGMFVAFLVILKLLKILFHRKPYYAPPPPPQQYFKKNRNYDYGGAYYNNVYMPPSYYNRRKKRK
jgi:hypothetical protein